MADKTTFVKITNKQIYDKIEALSVKLDAICEKQAIHEKILVVGAGILSMLAGLILTHIVNK